MKRNKESDAASEVAGISAPALNRIALAAGVIYVGFGFALGALIGFMVSRASVAEDCETHGRLIANDRVYTCTPGQRITDINFR